MMKRLRQSKGITLIALVITIIVVLILAGVSISMLSGESGILTKVNYAKEESNRATTEEKVQLAVLSALTAGNGEIKGNKAFEALNKGLNDAGYNGIIDAEKVIWPAIVVIGDVSFVISEDGTVTEIPSLERLKSTGKAVKRKTTINDIEGKTIVIPEGFKIAEDSATLVEEGVVVIAPDGSEFVWVPVEDINSMVMCQNHTGESGCNIIKGADGKLKCNLHTTDPKPICGKLYATTLGENFDSTLTIQEYNADSGLREPAVLTDTTEGDCASGNKSNVVECIRDWNGMTTEEYTDQQVIDKWTENLQNEFNEMAKSVYENKGFYVGRYETSLNGDKAQSKANQRPAMGSTFLNDKRLEWYGLYQIEKDYSIKAYNEKGDTLENMVGSTMIWGSQYDQMMLWMKANGLDIDVIQNESPNLGEGVEKNTNATTTGVPGDKDKLNNVYDLLGARFEWTLEAYEDSRRVDRGGYYWEDCYSVASRKAGLHNPGDYPSSRIALCIK